MLEGGKAEMVVSVSVERNTHRGAAQTGATAGTAEVSSLRRRRGLSTLIDLRYNAQQIADRGEHGRGKETHGKDAEDRIVKVPAGTIVRDGETEEVLADLKQHGQRMVVARGGIGGKGNVRFKSSIFQSPRVAEKGEPGEARIVNLEVKLIADIGLVGYPNAGKSTLLSRTSSAKPKIASYPFTTLAPNLGVVRLDAERNFVVADLPGLIDGAHEGTGLGHDFLRHIERTKVLIHVIDAAAVDGRAPIQDYEQINSELELYSPRLIRLPQLIALNKTDLPESQANLAELKAYFGKRRVFPISALTGDGIPPLLRAAYHLLDRINQRLRERRDTGEVPETIYPPKPRHRFELVPVKNGFIVYGEEPRRAVLMTDMTNEQAIVLLHRKLKKMGVMNALIKAGVKEGDTVRIDELEFTYTADGINTD